MKIVLVLESIIVGVMTFLSFFPDVISFCIAQGSYSTQEQITASPFLITFLALINFVLVLYYIKRKESTLVIPGLIVVLFIYTLSVRNIAYDPWPENEAKILTGFSFIRTQEIFLCNSIENIDCEKEIYYNTYIEKKSFWRLRVRNNCLDRTIFVGPFIWNETICLFNKYTYNKGILTDK